VEELYDYIYANRTSEINQTKDIFFSTPDGTNYTSLYDMTIDGCVLTGSGKTINFGAKEVTYLNGGSSTARIIDVNGISVAVSGVGVVDGSVWEVYKNSDNSVLGSGTASGTTIAFNFTYSSDTAVTLIVRKFGYLEATYGGTITAEGLVFNVAQVVDTNYASYAAGVATDFTIDTTALTITHTSGTTVYTVKDLYNYTMDYMASVSPDRLQKSLPMSAQTQFDFTLQNSYTMDDTTHEYLMTGSITEGGGDILWSNVFTVGDLIAGTTLYAEQNGAKLTGWWGTGNIDILLNVKTGGSLIDSGDIKLYARKYGTLYARNEFNLANGGRTAVSLSTLSELDNTTSRSTVATWSDITKTEGVDNYDIGDGDGPQPYTVKFDCAGRTIAQVYEWFKYLTDEDATATIVSVEGRIFENTNAAFQIISTAPLGTLVGGRFYGAQGVWIENIALADTLNYTLIDNNGVSRFSPPPPVSITISGLVSGSRVQIYDTTGDVEIYNDIVNDVELIYPYTYVSRITLGVRVKYTDASSAYLMYETTGAFSSAGASFTANQVVDSVYASNSVDGSSVTECSVSGATVRIYVDDPDNSTNFQRIYNWYQNVLFTEAGINDQSPSYFYAISTVEYRFDPSMQLINEDTVNPLTIVGANIAPTSGSDPIIDNTNGASTVIYAYFPVDGSGIVTGIRNNTNLIPALL